MTLGLWKALTDVMVEYMFWRTLFRRSRFKKKQTKIKKTCKITLRIRRWFSHIKFIRSRSMCIAILYMDAAQKNIYK